MTPWYRDTVEEDRQRTSQIRAVIHDRRTPPSTDPASVLQMAMFYDANLFRAGIEIRSLLALPQEVLARPGVIDRVREVATTREAVAPPCPSRDELLRMLA
jgi:hypothetical protein